MNKERKFGTLAIHAGQKPDPTTGAVMTPIYQTSTYAQSSPGVFKDGYDYARTKNPTRTALEENLAALEGGKYGLTFSSGCAALSTLLHILKSGDHVVACDDVYGGTFRLFEKVFLQMGITYSMVDFCDLKKIEEAITPSTKLIWAETPTNPMLKIFDIEAISKISKKSKILFAVDNTFASPYLQNPLLLGADIVSHSTTKYIGGHSDVVGGALIVNDHELFEKLSYYQNAIGAVPGPQDCFLLLRSTKTLHVRLDRHCDNAEKIMDFLLSTGEFSWVRYPFNKSHPQYEIAKRQMKRGGGMITAELKGGLNRAKKFLESVSLFYLAESLGGVESLIEHPAIMTHATIPAAQRQALGISDGLVRFSVGIEDVDDLILDIQAALENSLR